MKLYKIDLATPIDSMAVWQIRFDHSISQRSKEVEVVNFKEHDRWFQDKYFKNHDNKCFVLRSDNEVVGYCRFDLDQNGVYLVSIAIRPNNQGKGMGHILLSGSLKQLQINKPILANIRKNNDVSLKLFQKNGFIIYQEDSINYYLKR